MTDSRWLELKAKTTPAGNVFEWCWEHADLDSQDRDALMRIAFLAVGEPHPTVHPLVLAKIDPNSAGQLITVGYLAYDGVEQGFGFPTYQKWLDEQVTTDPDLAAAKAALDSWRAW